MREALREALDEYDGKKFSFWDLHATMRLVRRKLPGVRADIERLILVSIKEGFLRRLDVDEFEVTTNHR